MHARRDPRRSPTPGSGNVKSLALSVVGILIVVSVAIGAGIGMWLDGRFGTSPWLTVIGLVLGMTAGFREMWRMVESVGSGAESPKKPADGSTDENKPD